jgi:hypothetical protein
MNIRGAAALGCGLLLTLASCGSSRAVTTAAPAAPAAAVPQIYNFKTTKVGGGAVDGAEFAGKPTAFWFWAPT